MRSRIMVVSDDVALRARLAQLLGGVGYGIELAENAEHARRIGLKGLALGIVTLGGLGSEKDRLLRDLEIATGKAVLMWATPGTASPSAELLDVSAEPAMLARVAEALRPAPDADASAPTLEFSGYCLDLAGLSLLDPAGKEIRLRRGEFALLREFVQRPGRVLSRDQLLQALAGREAEVFDRSIDMLVVRLRRKIEVDPRRPSLIVTVPGSGYKFAARVQRAPAVQAQPGAALAERTPVSAERRQVTALCAELIAANGNSLPSDPEELHIIIDAYRRRAAAIVTRQGGVVAQYRAREVIAYFGHPVAQEHAAERAVHAGLALTENADRSDPKIPARLSVRIGIATGLVIVDPAGEVVGEVPSEAATLQGSAKPGQVAVTTRTRQLLGRLFDFQAVGPVTPKGAAGSIEAGWHVVGPNAVASHSEALYAGTLTPMVGREDELSLLLRAWQQAKSGDGRVVLLSGDPGIGKSRLLAALAERLTGETHQVLRYFCSPLHRDSPLHPIIMRWEQEAGFTRGDTVEQRLSKLESRLAAARLPPADVALLATMLAVPTHGRYPQPDLSPQRRKERTFAALIRRLASLANTRSLLLLFEDVHWADPSSLELIDILLAQISDLPVLLVISFRPEFAVPWIGRAGVSLVTLSRLDRRQSTILATQVIATHVLEPGLVDRIVAQSDGVPLFIEELTKSVLDAAPGPDGSNLPLAVPGTLQASLMARLDRLPAAKQVAQIGAVIGREFPHVLLAAAAELPEPQLSKGLEELVASGLVFRRSLPPDAVYTFKHALIQETAYASLLRTQRKQLHAQVAVALKDQFSELARTQPELLAFHYQRAGNAEQSFEYWTLAGCVSEQRGASSEAIAHFRSACEVFDLPEPPPSIRLREPEIGIKLGNALIQAEGFNSEDGRRAFDRARCAAGRLELPEESARAGIGIAALLFGQGRYRDAIAIGEDISVQLLGRLLPHTCVHLWTMLGGASYCIGEFATALAYTTRAAKLDDDVQCTHEHPIGGGDPAVVCRSYAGMINTALGFLDKSLAWTDEAWAIANARGHAFSIAWAGLNRMRSLRALGRDAESIAIANQSVDICERHGFSARLGNLLVYRGAARFAIGKREEGLADMRSGIAEWRRTSGTFQVTQWISEFAPCLMQLGRMDAAEQALREAEEIIGNTQEQSYCSEIRRLRGRLHECAGERDRAAVCYQQAVEWSRAQHAKLFELRASTSLARLWCDQGGHVATRELLAPVYGWFTEGLDAPDLRNARALLDDLAAPAA